MADSRRKGRKTQISGQFTWALIEMKEAPAWRVLSRGGRQVLDRLEIEMAHHGGNDNGKLPVTYDHFEEYGIHRHAVGPAIREVVALGFVEITREGRAGNAEYRLPTLYRLTYKPTDKTPATDDWRRVESVASAEGIASAARAATKQNPSGEKRQFSVRKPHHKPGFHSAETATTGFSAETATTSISRGGHQHSGQADGRRPTKQASPSSLSHDEGFVAIGDLNFVHDIPKTRGARRAA